MTLHLPDNVPVSPLDALLGAYAAGTLNVPLQALVAAHLEISPKNRRFVASLEAARAADVARMEPRPLMNRDAALAAIFAAAPSSAVHATSSSAADDTFPESLRRFAGMAASDVPWRFRLPGVREFRFMESDAGEAMLYWIKAGRRLPSHTHAGDEVTLLLRGGFTDSLGHYIRGDIAIADEDLDHKPRADEGEDCICFAVTDAPLQLTGPVSRLLRKVFGH